MNVYLVFGFDNHDSLLIFRVAENKPLAKTIEKEFQDDCWIDYVEIHSCKVERE